MKKYHYVYCIINLETKMKYIGKRSSVRDPKDDLGVFYFSSSTDKQFIEEQKVSPQLFEYLIIKEFETSLEAINYEIDLHQQYDVGVNPEFYNRAKSTSSGFNLEGIPKSEEQKRKIRDSNLGKHRSKETCLRISDAQKKRPPITDDTKQKLSLANKGRHLSDEHKNKLRESRLGKKVSDETKQKISDASKGRVQSEESNKKRSESLKDRIFSKETREKISKAHKGRKYSKEELESRKKRPPVSNETIVKLRESHKGKVNESVCKKVIQYDENMNIIEEFDSITSASRKNKCAPKSIRNCILDNSKKFKNCYWRLNE